MLWRGFASGASPEVVSVPQLVEKNSDVLRQRYLSWIYELGETRIQGRRLVDHLELRPEFSYWWMTLFAEKCNYSKSPQIDDAIRLMAFESWTTGQAVDDLVLATSNVPLAECIRSWCARSGVGFKWQRMRDEVENLSWLQRLYQALPHSVRAIAWLALYLFRRWPLKGAGLSGWCQTGGRTTFVSYLFNLTPDAARDGRFESCYWGHLPDELQRDGCKTNWLHLYVKDALLPNARKAADAIREFNRKDQGRRQHVTLDTFLGPKVVFRVLCDWVRVGQLGRDCQQALFSSRRPIMDPWPLFHKDWYGSLFGREAMANLLYDNLLESAMKSLPNQRIGIYLQENQGWEFAFIHAWKVAGHGHLIGSAHSTVRFWDLRYFFDPRSYTRSGHNSLPLPDQVALNGAAALDAYRMGGYPERDLAEVEALRYMHLADNGTGREPFSSPSSRSLRVLVLGEYRQHSTQQQMRLLEKVAPSLPTDTVITVKPHPASPVHPEDYPGLKLIVTMDPISKLLRNCDVAYTSNVTSAAVDAYCAGIPVVSLLDLSNLNLSPLRGRKGVVFASTPVELAIALTAASSATCSRVEPQSYFTLDTTLPRWRRLLVESQRSDKAQPRDSIA